MSFDENSLASIELAKKAALQILLHNAQGPFEGLPRTAGWGYPEPYTRDLMISALGFLTTGNEQLADALDVRWWRLPIIRRCTAISHPSRTIQLTVVPAIRRLFSSSG